MSGTGGNQRTKAPPHPGWAHTGRTASSSPLPDKLEICSTKKPSLCPGRPRPSPARTRAPQRAAGGFFSLFVFLHVLVTPVLQPEGSGPSETQEEGRAWLCHRTSGIICRNSPLPFPNLVKEQGPLSELGPFVPVPREEATSRRERLLNARSVCQSVPGGDAVPSPQCSGPSQPPSGSAVNWTVWVWWFSNHRAGSLPAQGPPGHNDKGSEP